MQAGTGGELEVRGKAGLSPSQRCEKRRDQRGELRRDQRHGLSHISKRRGQVRQAFLGIGQTLVLFFRRHDDPTADFLNVAPAPLANVALDLTDLHARGRDGGIHHATTGTAFAGQKA